jgi:hypothetical protein
VADPESSAGRTVLSELYHGWEAEDEGQYPQTRDFRAGKRPSRRAIHIQFVISLFQNYHFE